MTLKAKVANALSFAQMAGLGRSKAAKAEDEEDKKKEDAKAEDDESEAKAKAKAAEGDDEKKDDDAEEDDEKESKKAKKAKKAEKKDNDNDGDEDDGETMSAQQERARCKAIVAHGVKTGQVVHACAYAFDTEMSAAAAIATLDANLAMQPTKPAGSSLSERMAKVDTPVVKPEGEAPAAGSPQAIAAMVIAAAAKARGDKS